MKKKNQNVQTEKELRKEFNFELGQRIRSVRESLEQSQEKFSEECGISVSFLREIERGTKSPTAYILNKICKSSKVSADYYILSGEPQIKNKKLSAVQQLILELNDPQIDENLFNILKEYLNVITKIKKNFIAASEISATIEKISPTIQNETNFDTELETNLTNQNEANFDTELETNNTAQNETNPIID